MKREILGFKREITISGCCPNHDTWPVETYRSRRSKKARSRDKAKEHRHARHVINSRALAGVCEVDEFDQED